MGEKEDPDSILPDPPPPFSHSPLFSEQTNLPQADATAAAHPSVEWKEKALAESHLLGRIYLVSAQGKRGEMEKEELV